MSAPPLALPDLPASRDRLASTRRAAAFSYLALLIAVPTAPLVAAVSKAPALQFALCALSVLTTAGLITWQLLLARSAEERFPRPDLRAFAVLATGIGLIAIYAAVDLTLHIALDLDTRTFGVAALMFLAGVAKPCSDMLEVGRALRNAERSLGAAGLDQLWHFQLAQRPQHF